MPMVPCGKSATATSNHPQQFLNFLPLPQGQGSLRPDRGRLVGDGGPHRRVRSGRARRYFRDPAQLVMAGAESPLQRRVGLDFPEEVEEQPPHVVIHLGFQGAGQFAALGRRPVGGRHGALENVEREHQARLPRPG